MRRTKSVISERKSDRRRLQEKFSDRINTFRVCSNNNSLGKRYHPTPDNDNNNNNSNIQNDNNRGNNTLSISNNSVEPMNTFPPSNITIPLQQDSLYSQTQTQQEQEENLLYQILAMTPTEAFVPLPVNSNNYNNNIGFAIQTVPTSYPENFLSGFQDQTIINNVSVDNNNINNQLQTNFAANLAAFNQTVPGNVQQSHHHHHHGIYHYASDSSLLIPSNLINTYGEQSVTSNQHAADVLVNHHPSPPHSSSVMGVTTSSTQSTTVLPSSTKQERADSNEMPFRPYPPSFPGGPEYFQASEQFRSCFRQIDADDNGFITLEELRTFLQNKDKSNFNDDAVLTIMDMFDNNKDNMIDSGEFPDMLAFIRNWDSCFMFLDSDNSGTIDYREMLLAITSLGFNNLSHKFIVMLLKKYDCAGNGQINLDNFIVACVTLCRYKKLYYVMEQMFGSTGPKIDLEQFICLFMWPTANN